MLIFSLFLIGQSGFCAHLVGGEIFYECLGNGKYMIGFKVYRDCTVLPGQGATSFDDQINITIFRGADDVEIGSYMLPRIMDEDTLPLVVSIPCLVDTPSVCVASMEYRDTIDLQVPLGGLYITHQRCCRPQGVINLVNSSSYGTSYTTHIPDSTIADCNSSPRYNSVPPILLCSEIYTDLDYSASDKDGDSLVYSFCEPLDGGGQQFNPPNNPNSPVPIPALGLPYSSIQWANGFSDNFQISSLPAIEVDSTTGIFTGRPVGQGSHAVAVCVQEYRNGVLLSENRRDFLLNLVACEIDAAAAIDSLLEECIGFDIQFYNQSTLGNSFLWDFGDTTTNDDTSRALNPLYTYPDTGTYNIMLVSEGQVCNDTSYIEYRVQHKIEPYFDPPKPECFDRHKFVFEPEGFYRSTTNMTWNFDSLYTVVSEEAEPTDYITFDNVGIYKVHLTYEDLGCVKSYTDSVEVWPNPDFTIREGTTTQCAPFAKSYSVKTVDAHKPRFTWYLDSTLQSEMSTMSILLYDPDTMDIAVRMITDSLCIDTVDLLYEDAIWVIDTPQSDFLIHDPVVGMFTPVFDYSDRSTDAVAIEFYVENQFMTSDTSHRFERVDTGNYNVMHIATHENGCRDTSYQVIRVDPEYLTFVPNTFTPNDDGLNDIWLPSVFVEKSYLLEIYDQWGRAVFTTQDKTYGWNGNKWNGDKPCPIGIYTYHIYIVDHHDQEWFYTSRLSLLR